MERLSERIHFASAPVSWGVPDDPGPAWEQPYKLILDEILSAGYTGTELGPYGYFPTDPKVLAESLKREALKFLHLERKILFHGHEALERCRA